MVVHLLQTNRQKDVCNVHKHKAKQMAKKIPPKQNVSASIRALDVGDVADFPLNRYNYVVSCRSRVALSKGTAYTSEINRDNDTVRITRIE